MEREYDIFEEFPDGELMWHGNTVGLSSARRRIQELAGTTRNECFIVYLPTKEVVARVNVHSSRGVGRKPVVFQIAYDSGLANARSRCIKTARVRGCFSYRK